MSNSNSEICIECLLFFRFFVKCCICIICCSFVINCRDCYYNFKFIDEKIEGWRS